MPYITEVMIFCLVLGDAVRSAFMVDIKEDQTISHLKKLIKEEKKNAFGNIDANDIMLWKVDADINIEQELGGMMLLPSNTIKQCFRNIFDKKLYPLPALQSTSGEGKSFFLDELTSLKSEDLDRYLKIKLFDLEKEQGSGKRQQYTKDIVDLLHNSVGICITYNGGSPYGYDIDEDLRRRLVMRILWSYFFDENKPINWIPLRRLALSESVELFHEITKSLNDRRLFIIKKCIADCNGHPRILEKFYQLLHDNIALNTNVYSSLIEYLAKNLDSLFGKIIFLICEIKTTLGTSTLRDLIFSRIYINSLTDNNETFNIIPTLLPVSLQYFCMFSKNDVNDNAKTVAKILRDLLTTEYFFDNKVMDEKPFERFHANWELLYCALRDDEKEVNLYKIYVEDTGYIAINIEYKFSYPGRIIKLSNNEIKKKYEHTKNIYYNHVRYEWQKIRNSPINWEEGKFYDRSAIGKLKMTIDNVYLVFIAWRDVEPLDNEIKNNKNIIIVKRENLKEIYTPSLVTRPHFYNDIVEQIKI
ncbi:644_t:CDS:2 [Racocetra fulgida]|uniref:644_t:CDS:1 n=1 Tax=Racocetra fulgida TaxID=60492 RepID=A0A9N9GG86_9GLOM|nr:644_t:CDS:2 [Racocetra fulgida]